MTDVGFPSGAGVPNITLVIPGKLVFDVPPVGAGFWAGGDGGGVTTFATVTVTPPLVVVFPAVSRATAVSVCDAFVVFVVSQLTL
jgi:hypothetical protein